MTRRGPIDGPGKLALGWLVVIGVATLWPAVLPRVALDAGVAGPPHLPELADVGRNVVLYAPLGFALGLGRHGLAVILALGVVLAVGVELAQLAIPGRDPSVADVAVDALAVAVGALLARRASASLRARGGLNALVLGVSGAGALLLPALALRPVAYSGFYYPAWTPDPPPLVQFPGRVVAARIGELPLPAAGRSPDWETLGARLAAGAPLAVRAVLDGPPGGVAPIVRVNGEGFELLLLAADGRDLVLRQRTRGDVLGFEAPLFTAAGSLGLVQPGATFDLELRSEGLGWQVRVGDGAPVSVGPTPGSAWRLWFRSAALPEALRRAVDALSVGLVFLAVGFWLRPSWAAGVGLLAVVSALLAGPGVGGLLPTPAREWAAAAAGLALGLALACAARRCADRGRQRTAMGPT
jgi:VanZ family protein